MKITIANRLIGERVSIGSPRSGPRRSWRRMARRIASAAVAVLTLGPVFALAPRAQAATDGQAVQALAVSATSSPSSQTSGQSGISLESAASKAGSIGRKVAMSLIALGFSLAAIMLVFRRDFKEAAGVFVIGLLAILLATPSGVQLLHGTVQKLFGS